MYEKDDVLNKAKPLKKIVEIFFDKLTFSNRYKKTNTSGGSYFC